MPSARPSTLGELRAAVAAGASRAAPVKDEIRENLIARLRAGEPLFPGIIGYDDTVVPQIVNAILSRHNFILLGLRGQAKSRILRALDRPARRRDPRHPGLRDPRRPAGAALRRVPRARPRRKATPCRSRWLPRDARYVEKLATPDVTIADMIGDLDPIKAARAGLQLADELTMHYGLLPRANRGIFAINELPDLAGKIQVGLFNILQEGDVQIKGYPVRLPLDVLMVFSANPEDYTARGKIITPLKDRIGSEIRTHYPATRHARAWRSPRRKPGSARRRALDVQVPDFVREIVEEVAFQARQDSEDRQAVGRQPAAADLAARERRLERRAARAARRRDAGRAARHRHLRRAAGDHRQVRARVRRRAARRRQRRARHHPRRGRQRLRRATSPTPICGRSPNGSTSAARSRSTTRSPRDELLERTGDGAGTARARAGMRASTGRAPPPVRAVGGRLRARRALRAEEDQPLRRVAVPGRRAAAPPAARAASQTEPMLEREHADCRAKQEVSDYN